MEAPVISEETRILYAIEKALANIFALSLSKGPGGRIHSWPQSECESFPGLLCLELYAGLRKKNGRVRIAILQGIWNRIQKTITEVTFALVFLAHGLHNLIFMATNRHINKVRKNQNSEAIKAF
jgi:hypothetical protein